VRLSNFVVILLLMIFVTPALATGKKQDTFKAGSASLFVASAGEVVVTFLSKSAAYSDDIFLEGSSTRILNNQTAIAGQQFSLGSFQAGTELVFRLFVNNTGYSFYNGSADNNPDSVLHTAYKKLGNNYIVVGFEDIFKGGDKDYNDVIFSVSNVTTRAPVPEPEMYLLMLMGLVMISRVKRNKIK
jgi:hypothetical protein